MNSLCITPSSSSHLKLLRHAEANSSWGRNPLNNTTTTGFKITNSSYSLQHQKSVTSRRTYGRKAQKCSTQLSKNTSKVAERKKGTVAGAVARYWYQYWFWDSGTSRESLPFCLLLAIEVLAVVYGGWSGVGGISDWGKVPPAIPVIIFSLVYHDLLPVLCAYLEGDLRRIKASVFLGSLVPLVALLVWDAIVLGLSAEAEQVTDPVELLYRVRWSGVSVMIGGFSLLAVGTSLIGTLLGFSEFFKEQLKILTWHSSLTQKGNWGGNNKMNATAVTMVVAPSLVVSTTFPDAFSAATDIAGGYWMTVLYGVLPPAMAWAMHKKEPKLSGQKELSNARPALIMVGLFACSIVVEQILQDILALHS